MKNFLKLAFVVFLLIAFKSSWALEQNTNGNTSEAVPLATVNIYEAKVASQSGNNFKISFFLTNREGFQTEVKYGVRLYTQDEKGKLDLVVSEKVYDEQLNISPGAKVKKEIDYSAPDVLDGEYRLAVLSYNAKGFPLAFVDLGKVKVTRALKGVEILNDSCFVKINKGESKINTNENIFIKPEDSLYLDCIAVNHDSNQAVVATVFDTKLGSAYGETVSPTGGDDKGVVFKAGEKKEFSVLIPTKSIDPQVYNLSFSLKGDESSSNQVKLDYRISGTSATLYNVSLDKSNYKDGETAKVTALLRVNKAEASESNPLKYYLNVNILNDKNVRCGKQFTKEIDNSFISNFSVLIDNNCSKPQIIATITDSNGKILSQMGNANIKNSFGLNTLEYIITILAIVILVILIIISKKNKKNKMKKPTDTTPTNTPTQNIGTVTSLVLLIAVSVFTSFFFTHKASADTFCLTNLSNCDVQAVVSTDKSSYQPGNTITVGGYLTTNTFSSVNGHTAPLYSLKATQSSTTKTFSNPASYSTITFTAPSSPGSYSISVQSGVGCNAGYRIDSKDGGCAAPAITVNFNKGVPSDTSSPRYREQEFKVGESVMPGDVFSATVYSHGVSVTAVSGDTQDTIATKLANAVDATTVAQWDEYGSATYTHIGTSSYDLYSFGFGTKPMANCHRPSSGAGNFILCVNWQNQFGASGSPANYSGSWKYSTYSLGYSVVNAPTISISSSSSSINSGSCVTIDWKGNNLDNCIITATPQGGTAVDLTPQDMRTTGNLTNICPTKTTTYTAYCSTEKPSCWGSYACTAYSDNDENCVRAGCNWN